MEILVGVAIHLAAFMLVFYVGRKTGYNRGRTLGRREGMAERLTIANSLLDGSEGFWFK